MTIIGSSRKPSARLATGWTRGFENAPEMSKGDLQRMLAEAASNTAAISKRAKSAKAKPVDAGDEIPA